MNTAGKNKTSEQQRADAAIQRVERAFDELRAGRIVIVSDDEDRECEGDFLMAAAFARAEDINLMAREGRGLICCPIDTGTARRLDLQIQLDERYTALHGTAFTQGLDAAEGTTTGISAKDRAVTLKKIAALESQASDFARPGHIFPIVAKPGGVLERGGHTEASVDLCILAGLPPVGVICEIMKEDGSMASGESLKAIAARLGLLLISVADIVHYRRNKERLIQPLTSASLPTRWGTFSVHHLASPYGPTKRGLLILSRGKALEKLPTPKGNTDTPLLVRVHSECLTGDLFSSLRCDCGEQLEESMRRLGEEDEGALIYLHQEGRGIGLDAKLRAYSLQDQGLDTVDANIELGYPPDMRDYWEAAQALKLMGRTSVRLLTNNPDKVTGLESYGIRVAERIPLLVPSNKNNEHYMKTKRERLGHVL
jgi:3,4-dihydroxy 2-butanone 4-phosphate synthase/GTP cyclohydrolase II